jgi:outer membrane protein OmpA-like peptidoglycan-associated protein
MAMKNIQPFRIKPLVGLLLLIALTACAKPRTVLVLMSDPDGSVGAVEISNAAGSQTIDQAGQAVRVKRADQKPKPPENMEPEEIQALFGPALEALPPLPEKFILNFVSGTTGLTEESKNLLPEIIAALKRHHPAEVSVVGHTDRTSTDQANYLLALERAQMVRDFLIEAGMDRSLIEVDSHGETNPLVPTADGVAEPRNRRVEVFVR